MKQKTRKTEYEFSGSDLLHAVQEGLSALRTGKVGDLRHTTIELPKPAPELPPAQIKAIRKKMGASQAVFARLLNIPTRTAIAWESGRRRPSGAALKLLHIARRRPEVLVQL